MSVPGFWWNMVYWLPIQAGLRLKLACSKGRRPPDAVSVFIAWIKWTLTMSLPWWQHYKYCRGYYYYHYFTLGTYNTEGDYSTPQTFSWGLAAPLMNPCSRPRILALRASGVPPQKTWVPWTIKNCCKGFHFAEKVEKHWPRSTQPSIPPG